MKILVIDDSDTSRAHIRLMLQNLGFNQVEEVNDGGEALLTMGHDLFELVILDWEMPNITGIQVLKAIRNNARTQNVPVLMCTSIADSQHISDAMSSGANSYIAKPYSVETFENKFKEMGFIR